MWQLHAAADCFDVAFAACCQRALLMSMQRTKGWLRRRLKIIKSKIEP